MNLCIIFLELLHYIFLDSRHKLECNNSKNLYIIYPEIQDMNYNVIILKI